MNRIPIFLLCGFLGSGKTTLLRRWRRDSALRDAAVIVHDLSDFGLDAELVGGDGPSPVAGELSGRVAALHGRHARDLLPESVGRALQAIVSLDPPASLVLVESTGAARPGPLLRAFMQDDRFALEHFIVTVDALSLWRDFDAGASLAPFHHTDRALQIAATLLVEQATFANLIIVTKTDTVPKVAVETMVRHLERVNPRATIGLSAQAGLRWKALSEVPPPDPADWEAMAASLAPIGDDAATPTDFECTLIRDPRPFHPQRLYDACQSQLGTGLYRTKGYLWLASRPGHVLLWQQSGSQISLELTGLWRAELAANRHGKLLPEEVIALRRQLETEDPIFGDRHTELTLIGLAAARNSFASALRQAFCTTEEIDAWRNGSVFADPWPSVLRRA
jgi:G3E family GTPase